MLGAGAPGDLRRHLAHVDRVLAIELGVGIGGQRAPVRDGAVPHRVLGREVAAGEIVEGDVVGRHHAGARAHLDREIADREPSFDRQAPDRRAGIFDGMAGAGRRADIADQVQDHVLGRHALGDPALEMHAEALGLALDHGLGGERMHQLRGADAEGERAHAAMGAGVAVAADQGRAGQGERQLGPDDVHDAVAVLAEVEQADAVLGRGGAHVADQRLAGRKGLLGAARRRRDGMVGRAVDQPRLGRRIAFLDGFLQGARTGQVVQQQTVDMQQHEAVAEIGDDVAVPDLVEQGLGHLGVLQPARISAPVQAGRKPFLDLAQSIAQALGIEVVLAIATGSLGWRRLR